VWVKRIDADVDPIQSGFGQRTGQLAELDAIGGHRQRPDTRYGCHLPHDSATRDG
jgi:hypothetical protein